VSDNWARANKGVKLVLAKRERKLSKFRVDLSFTKDNPPPRLDEETAQDLMLVPLGVEELRIEDAFSPEFTHFSTLKFCPLPEDEHMVKAFETVKKEMDTLARTDFHDRMGCSFSSELEKAVLRTTTTLCQNMAHFCNYIMSKARKINDSLEHKLKENERRMMQQQLAFTKEIDSYRYGGPRSDDERNVDVMFMDSINAFSEDSDVRQLCCEIVKEKVGLILTSQKLLDTAKREMDMLQGIEDEESANVPKGVPSEVYKRIEELEDSLEKSKKKVESLEKRLEYQNEGLDAQQEIAEQNENLKKTSMEWSQKVEDLEAELQKSESEILRLLPLEAEIKMWEEKHSALDDERTIEAIENTAKTEKLEDTIEELMEQLKASKAEHEKAVAKIASLTQGECFNCQLKEREIEDLQCKVDETLRMQSANDKKAEEYQLSQSESERKMEKQKEEVEEACRAVTEKLQSTEKEMESVSKMLDEASARNNVLEQKLRDEQRNLAEKEEEAVALKSAIAEIRLRLSKSENKLQARLGEKETAQFFDSNGLADITDRSSELLVPVWVRLYTDAMKRLERYERQRYAKLLKDSKEELYFMQAMYAIDPRSFYDSDRESPGPKEREFIPLSQYLTSEQRDGDRRRGRNIIRQRTSSRKPAFTNRRLWNSNNPSATTLNNLSNSPSRSPRIVRGNPKMFLKPNKHLDFASSTLPFMIRGGLGGGVGMDPATMCSSVQLPALKRQMEKNTLCSLLNLDDTHI